MIEALKDDAVLSKFGGRFKLCILVQSRLRELIDGARPLVERDGRSDLEVVFEEIKQDKITIEDSAAPATSTAEIAQTL